MGEYGEKRDYVELFDGKVLITCFSRHEGGTPVVRPCGISQTVRWKATRLRLEDWGLGVRSWRRVTRCGGRWNEVLAKDVTRQTKVDQEMCQRGGVCANVAHWNVVIEWYCAISYLSTSVINVLFLSFQCHQSHRINISMAVQNPPTGQSCACVVVLCHTSSSSGK